MNPPLPNAVGRPIGEARLHFDVIAEIARRDAGLTIPPEKAPMVFARLAKRLRALGLKQRDDYCRLVSGPDGALERRHLISALTTNVTGFFREAHHFDLLMEALQTDISVLARSGRPIRLWSAGCSNGSEPYSMAMSVLDAIPDATDLDIKILATDIDPVVLKTGRTGIYDEEKFRPLPAGYKARFTQVTHQPSDSPTRQVSANVKKLVSFRELNLLADWPMRRQFEFIFCRNVVIYFDKSTQDALWSRFAAVCRPNGYLCLGHSERLPKEQLTAFQPAGTTTYRLKTSPPPHGTSKKDNSTWR